MDTQKSAASKGNSGEEETCFVIMPFGGWFDKYYETVYVPAIKAAGLRPRRGDDLYRPSTIVHDIWECTQSAKLVLADLSGKNPNVLYELGLAHALAKPAILVTELIEDVPFDLRALRVIDYNKNEPMWGDKLKERITGAINEIIKSPLQSVLPAFLSVKPDAGREPISEQDRALLELRREIDLLRSEVARSREAPMIAWGIPSVETETSSLNKAARQRILDAFLAVQPAPVTAVEALSESEKVSCPAPSRSGKK